MVVPGLETRDRKRWTGSTCPRGPDGSSSALGSRVGIPTLVQSTGGPPTGQGSAMIHPGCARSCSRRIGWPCPCSYRVDLDPAGPQRRSDLPEASRRGATLSPDTADAVLIKYGPARRVDRFRLPRAQRPRRPAAGTTGSTRQSAPWLPDVIVARGRAGPAVRQVRAAEPPSPPRPGTEGSHVGETAGCWGVPPVGVRRHGRWQWVDPCTASRLRSCSLHGFSSTQAQTLTPASPRTCGHALTDPRPE